MEGRDIMGLAQTGTGKTAAFVLPVLQQLLSSPGRRRGPRTLVIVPTRELAEQVQCTVQALSKGTGIHSVTVYGGVSAHHQIRNLKNNPDIVIACPGRLLDHIRQRTVNLSSVEHLILDEADQMFDMGFLKDIRSILQALPAQKQTMMFSATMPPEIRKLTAEVLKNPLTIQADKGGPAKTVSHSLFSVKQDRKSDMVRALLKKCTEGSVLIFARTKHRAKKLSETLTGAGLSATCLQGNLSQSRRREAIDGFRKGSYRIMVATDIAARGIDISLVSHVINYDMPDTIEAYTHRIGRTGRAAQTGSALTLVTREDESMVRSIERVIGERIVRGKVEGFEAGNPAERTAVSPSSRKDVPNQSGRPSRKRPDLNGNRHPSSERSGRQRKFRREDRSRNYSAA